jgi:hypothetical protein
VAGPVDDLIAEGREAFRHGDGAASRRAFEAALATREDAELLEGLGRALYLEVDYPASMAAHERAYRAYLAEGNALGAARAARALAWMHANLHGDWAVASGWTARVRSFLEEAGPDSAEHGWVEVLSGISEPDPVRRLERFRVAADLGRRCGDPDLWFEATSWVGVDLVLAGRVAEGMASSTSHWPPCAPVRCPTSTSPRACSAGCSWPVNGPMTSPGPSSGCAPPTRWCAAGTWWPWAGSAGRTTAASSPRRAGGGKPRSS